MIGKFIQDLLNTTDLEFRVTDERQEFDTYKKSDKYVAGIVTQLLSNYLYDKVGNRVTSFQVEFEGKNKDFKAFKEVLQAFPDNELYDDFYIYSQQPIFDDFSEEGGNKKFKARLFFQLVEVIGGISGKTQTIKVDGEIIPFTETLFRKDKSVISNVSFGTNNNVKFINETLTLTLPILDIPKIQELYLDVMDDTFNKKYEVVWSVGGIIKTASFVSRGGFLNTQDTPDAMTFSIILERALPRKTFEIAMLQEEKYWEVEATSEDKVYSSIATGPFEDLEAFSEWLEEIIDPQVGTIYRYTKENLQTWSVEGKTPDFPFDENIVFTNGEINNVEEAEAYVREEYSQLTTIGYVIRIETRTLVGDTIYFVYYYCTLTNFSKLYYYGTYKDVGTYESYKTIPAIEYGISIDHAAESIGVGLNIKAILTTFSRGFKAIILSGDKAIADDAILAERRKYKIKFEFSGNEYEIENLLIQTAGIPVSEHGDVIMEITWVEGV